MTESTIVSDCSPRKLAVVGTGSLYFYVVRIQFSAVTPLQRSSPNKDLCRVCRQDKQRTERKERDTVCAIALEFIARLASGRQQSESVHEEGVILLMKLPKNSHFREKQQDHV